MKTVVFAAVLLVLPSLAASQMPLQQSHVEANVPSQQDFEAFLDRDLLAHFKGAGFPSATAVEAQLLRKEPTQSGVAYPKYYAWIKIKNGSQLLTEGAVRVAAIGQKRFEVTNFLSRKQIQSNSGEVATVFPGPLLSAIFSLAGSK
jgi:hypothetical protein